MDQAASSQSDNFLVLHTILVNCFVGCELFLWIAGIFPCHVHGMQEDAHELLALLLDAIDPPPGNSTHNGNKELPYVFHFS